MTAEYQVMPPLADEDFAALKADIEARGVLVPVEYDEDGNILDGHHRVQACEELGITDWPRFIRKGLSEDEKRAHARQLNLARRHLNREQKRELIKAQLVDTPERSNRQVAESLGVSHPTVANVRQELEESGDVEKITTSTDTLGRRQPARKPVRTAYVDPTPEGKQETLAVAKDIRSQLNTERKAERAERAKTLTEQVSDLPGGKRYRVIYADPPWSYGDKRDDTADRYTGAQNHYPSMSIAELCDLPVKALAQDDAVLFLWVTSPLLYEAAPIFDAWGFKYKSSFVWDKVGHNVGHYNSVRHEFLLIGTRGSCTPDVPTLHDSVVEIPKSRKHSEKPEEFRQLIDSMYPHGLRLELFRRGAAPDGWDVWGNEADARNAS